MHRNSLLTFVGLMLSYCSLAQNITKDLIHSRRGSFYTYVFRLTDTEARGIYQKDLDVVTNAYFHTLVDSFPTGKYVSEQTKVGHYLLTNASGDQLSFELQSVNNLEIKVLNNQVDLAIWVSDSLGRTIADAQVQVKAKPIPFDKPSQTYRLHKANRRGLLAVTYQGHTTYQDLDARYKNGRVKRASLRVLSALHIGYLLKPFQDIRYSLKYGRPNGWIKSLAGIFDPDYRQQSRTHAQEAKGYLVFNKPMYQPGDTVKLKAFVVNKKGKPINDSLSVRMNIKGQSKILASLGPYRKGGYSYAFPLSDSLNMRLGNYYSVDLQNRNGKILLSNSFQYEDYELKANTFKIRTEKEKHYVGSYQSLYAKGTDENELNVMDAKVIIMLKPRHIRDIHDSAVFVPDTLWKYELPLESVGETKIVLPDSIFPPISLDYQVEAVFLTASNERHAQTLDLSYEYTPKEIRLSLQQDSLVAEYLVAGVSKTVEADLTIYADKDEEKILVERTVTLPFKEKINPLAYSYELEAGGHWKSLEIGQESTLIRCLANRTMDSIFVQVDNPRHLSFWYTIYRKNKAIKRGTQMDNDAQGYLLKTKTDTPKNYFVSLQYLWKGQVQEEEYQVSLATQQLDIEVDQPAVVYPGQTTQVTVSVSDAAGLPASNVDLTAYGFTRKFLNASQPILPNFEKNYPDRQSINTFTLKEKFGEHSDFESDSNLPLDLSRWQKAMGLDTLAYYHFLYPRKGVFSHYTAMTTPISMSMLLIAQYTGQFMPYVVLNGKLLPAYLIYLDGKPIYYKDTDVVQRYSFPATLGYHYLQIRTYDKLVTYDSLYIRPGQQLILSLEASKTNAQVRIDSMPNQFTKDEQQLLNQYMLFMEKSYDKGSFAYLQQGNYVQRLTSSYGSQTKVGLFSPNEMQFVWKDHFNTTFTFEPRFTYEFQPQLLKMRKLSPQNFYKFSLSPAYKRLIPDFNEKAATVSEVDLLWQWQQEAQASSQSTYNNPSVTTFGQGKLSLEQIYFPAKKADQIKFILLFREDDANFLRVYPGSTRVFHQLKPGRYKLVFLLYFNEYTIEDCLEIQPNGTLYRQVKQSVIYPADDFSQKAAKLIQKAGYLFKQTAQDIKEQYHQTFNLTNQGEFTHLVEGEVQADDNSTLPGVSVLVKGTSVGTSTDANGHYRLYAPANGVLVFSFIGFVMEEVLIQSRKRVNVMLNPDIKCLSEVVVMGYGSAAKSCLTAAVSTTVAGKLPGVAFSGRPGATAAIQVSSSSEPLLIVDGVPFQGKLSELDPTTIASVEKLKDEIASVLYGSRAANGAIIITTKKGKAANAQKANNRSPADGMAQTTGLRSRFSDYAYWQPRLQTDQHGKASFQVTFPDDVTNWRTFVLAMDDQKRTGFAEASVKAFKTLLGSLSVPSFLVRGDTTQAIGKTLNYTLDTLSVTTAFEVDGKPSQVRQARVINSLIDTLQLTTHIANDSVQVKYQISKADGYQDGEMRPIPIYPLGTTESKGVFLNLDRDTTFVLPFDPALGTVKLYAQADVLEILLEELVHVGQYEYLCNEQAASKLKALLLEKKVRHYLNQPFKHESDIQKLIRRLEQSQGKDGTWGWWPGSNSVAWISRHVVEALVAAEKDGFIENLNRTQLGNSLVYDMESNARSYKIQSLALLQSLGSKVDIRRYVEALERDSTLDFQDKLQLIELKQRANLPYQLDTLLKHQQETMFGNLFWGKDRYNLTDNSITTTVLAYRILRLKGGYEAHLNRIRHYFLEKRQMGYWRNTYESALILETILPDLLNGEKSIRPSRLLLSGAKTDTITTFPYQATFASGQSLTIRKEGKLPVYLTAYQQFQNTNPKKVEKDFVVKTSFEGKSAGNVTLDAGKPITLRVEVQIAKDADYVMIEVPIPAGCSYEDKRIDYGQEAYREYFRHKTSIFCHQLTAGKHTFTIHLLPRYSGSYTLNPAKAELMYYPIFFGRNEMKRVKVK